MSKTTTATTKKLRYFIHISLKTFHCGWIPWTKIHG